MGVNESQNTIQTENIDALASAPAVQQQGNRRNRFWVFVVAGLLVAAVVIGVVVGISQSEGGSSNSSSDDVPLAPEVEVDNGEQPPAAGGPVETPSQVLEIIAQVALFDGTEFADSNSYQSMALAFLETSIVGTRVSLTRSFTPEERIIQLYALACIYYATDAVSSAWTDMAYPDEELPGWFVSDGWVTSADECTWFGVVCDVYGRVTELNLAKNRLTGSFPPEVTLLKDSLTRLDLNENEDVFNDGDEGNAFLGELTNLQYLFYSSTNFQYKDGIPTEIGLLTNLIEFDCSYALYFGPLKDEVFQGMNDLEFLDISGNYYNSTIPSVMSMLPSLEDFYAADAFISGDLSFMEGMPAIFEFWIDTNPGMGGTIPSFIGDLSTLKSFSVTECDFTGTLPTEIGKLTTMKQMWFYSNPITGSVPSEYGNILSLRELSLVDTDMTGTIPAEVCSLATSLFGHLDHLYADCDGEVECECCDCCGLACIPDDTDDE